MYRRCFKDYFGRDRKALYIVLGIVMISVLTLSVVYAALSTTLNINGNAEVSSASWDIHLANVQLNSNSVTTTAPTITNSTTATFSTTLSKPGDFYEFTIDVVNDGSIDAMIDGVTKTPTLTEAQAKYLNYIVEYQNGESINTKQIVSKNSFVRLKVKLEFRKDITASDLPTTSETLNLSFTVNYVQSDDSSENITIDNNGKLIKIVSGDGTQVGDEICIGQECFYVMSSDEDSVTMLAKYNLEVGNVCTSSTSCTPIENSSGLQDSTNIGRPSDNSYPRYGTTEFSSTNYWYDDSSLKSEYGTSYPAYVYDSNSTLYNYVESYRTYLESQGAEIEEARLIKVEELEALGCSGSGISCTSAPEWVYATSYWSGSAHSSTNVWEVVSDGSFGSSTYSRGYRYGVRPVIVLKS